MYKSNCKIKDNHEDADQVISGTVANRIEKKVKALFRESRGSHDWDHTLRVHRLCCHIGRIEGADMDVLQAAALLHDIGRSVQDISNGDVCHAIKGAEMAAPIINELPFSLEQKQNIIHCISVHRFRGQRGRNPETTEAKILFDADKLDAIGAVGVARAFLFAGEVGARLHSPEKKIEDTTPYSKDDTGYREYRVKLSKIKGRMLTKEGKRLANERHAYMENFFKQFLKEYEGKG